jgi:hypothetical protein
MTALYDSMAATVTRLLTQYGTAVNIVRPALNFDNATNKPTSGGNTVIASIGVFREIARRLVDGTRIQSGDRELVMVPDVEVRMGDRIDVSSIGDTTATTVGGAPGIILGAGVAGSWAIQEINEVRPAGTILAYVVRVRR